jgi:enamine deaminase RidA (YjgF/YER057c/UK114 family)
VTKRYLQPSARYSKAVRVGSTIYLSAVYPLTSGPSAAEQMCEVLELIDSYLAELGAMRADIVKATVFVANIADFAAINEVWDTWVTLEYAPARTPVFGPLLRPEAKVGVEVIAVAEGGEKTP